MLMSVALLTLLEEINSEQTLSLVISLSLWCKSYVADIAAEIGLHTSPFCLFVVFCHVLYLVQRTFLNEG